MRKRLKQKFPLQNEGHLTITERLEQYITEHPVELRPHELKSELTPELDVYIKNQINRGQAMLLPQSWGDHFKLNHGEVIPTDQGLVTRGNQSEIMLIFHSGEKIAQYNLIKNCLINDLNKLEHGLQF